MLITVFHSVSFTDIQVICLMDSHHNTMRKQHQSRPFFSRILSHSLLIIITHKPPSRVLPTSSFYFTQIHSLFTWLFNVIINIIIIIKMSWQSWSFFFFFFFLHAQLWHFYIITHDDDCCTLWECNYFCNFVIILFIFILFYTINVPYGADSYFN